MKIGLVACSSSSHKDFFSPFAALSSLETALAADGHVPTVLAASSIDSPALLADFERLILVGNPFADPRSAWSQWLVSAQPELCEKITIVEVMNFQAQRLLEEQKQVLSRIAKKNAIAVCDPISKEELATIVGNKAVLTGPLAYWTECRRPLRLKKKTRLFAPSATDPVFSHSARTYRKLLNRFYRRWNQAAPVIYCGVHSEALDLAATPGEATFFQPTAPGLLRTAIASADAVVAGQVAMLLVGIQHGVPGILLSNDPTEKKMAECLGIPFLESHSNTEASELVHRTEEILAKYPWDTVKQKSAKLLEKAAEYLSETGLVKKASSAKKKTSAPAPDRHWATTASEESLGTVLGWAENILSIQDGKNHFHILCSTRAVEAALETALRPGSWTAYTLNTLWNEDEWQDCRRASLSSALKGSKARFLLKVLGAAKSEVFYSDPEVLLFREPQELVPSATSLGCFLTRFSDSADATEHGLYSGSLFSVQPNAVAFLNWWSAMALEAMARSGFTGGYEEGKILNSAPLLFPELTIVRRAGVLAEPENLDSTSIRRPFWPGDALQSFDGATVAGFASKAFDSLHAHEIKTGWDQLAATFTQSRKVFTSNVFRQSVWSQQRLHWPKVDDFFRVKEWCENHVPMLAHACTPREIRFFTRGFGRLVVRAAVSLGLSAPPLGNVRTGLRPETSPVRTLWSTWQKTLLRGHLAGSAQASRHTQVA